MKLPAGALNNLLNNLSIKFGFVSLKLTIIRVKTKKVKSNGKTLKPHTLTAFKQEFMHIVGLNIKNKQIINKNMTIILFDFKCLIIYNNIEFKRGL